METSAVSLALAVPGLRRMLDYGRSMSDLSPGDARVNSQLEEIDTRRGGRQPPCICPTAPDTKVRRELPKAQPRWMSVGNPSEDELGHSQWRSRTARDKPQQCSSVFLAETLDNSPEHPHRLVVRESRGLRVGTQVVNIDGRLFSSNDLLQFLLIKHAQPLGVDDIG